jgi:PAS domain S-box-containing protein
MNPNDAPVAQRVLVVDDHAGTLAATMRVVASAGYQVAPAETGQEALQRVAEFNPHLVLLDMFLPDLSGTEVLARIRADARSENTTVVFLSAQETRADRQAAALDAGADGYIARPVTNKELLARVRKHLRQHGLAATLRASEEGLRSSHRQMLEMAEAIPQIVWIADPDGASLHCNQRWIQFTGSSIEQSKGQGWLEHFHPDDHFLLRSAWAQARDGEADYTVECRLRGHDGRYRWMLNRGQPIRDAQGGIARWIGTCTDIDELKRAQEAAHASEHALRALTLELEAERARLVAAQGVAKVGSWESEPETGHFAWSAETHRIFGTVPGKFLPTHAGFLAFVHPDDREAVDRTFQRSFDTRTPMVMTHRVLAAEGQVKYVEERWQVLDGPGVALRAVGTCQDITERRALEERLHEAQRLEAAGQLTGGMAHDFNNLLTVILGNAEMLTEHLAGNARLAPLAQMVVSAAERGAELTQRLLAFARRQALAPQAVDVEAQVVALETLLRRTLGEHIAIVHTPGAPMWRALVDPAQLDNALLNLCLNSRDAMPQGGRLTIASANVRLGADEAGAQADVRPGDYVMVTVSDTGGGIPPEHLGRVFEPFFTTKSKDKGTGLGLAMIYGFTKQSGGHVTIASEPGQGTTVKLYLPRALGQEADAERTQQESQALQPAPADPGGTASILLVEDDTLVRRYACEQLLSLGYRVTEAANGAEALDILRGGAVVDLLLTDVVMPGMNGRELADEALRGHPGLRVLYTSGYSEDTIVHHGRLDPGVQLLAKPYRRADLARRVRAALALQDASS